MQPRQKGLIPRSGGGRASGARPSVPAANAATRSANAPPRTKPRPSTASSSSDDRPPRGQLSVIKKKKPAKNRKGGNHVWRWHLGYIYAFFGILDIAARVLGMILWRLRYQSWTLPSISDTQREDIFTGEVTEKLDFLRLVITGSNSVIRCAANFIILWHAVADLRPAWGLRLMRWFVPPFRALLCLWVFADLMQAFIPNIPPDPAEHQITTPHIFFSQVCLISCGIAYFVLMIVMFFDLDTGKPSLVAGMVTSVLMTFSYCYYTTYLFKGITGKSTPMLWAIVTEIDFMTFNVGIAMPLRIVAMPGDIGRTWLPKFLREGKVRVYEDTSARTGSKPLLFTGKHTLLGELDEDEEEFLQRQQEELATLNSQFRNLFGSSLDAWDEDEAEAVGVDAEAGGAGVAAQAGGAGVAAGGAGVATPAVKAGDEPDF